MKKIVITGGSGFIGKNLINLLSQNNKYKIFNIDKKILSGNYDNLEYFKFITDEGFIDYFNREGKNVCEGSLCLIE